MPYSIESNLPGCSGFAVVKEGTKEPIAGGCHKTKAEAIAHMVAVDKAYEQEDRELEVGYEPGSIEPKTYLKVEIEEEEGLSPKQAALYSAYEAIAEEFGMFDKGDGENGSHYMASSPFQERGLICANCVFFEGGRKCEIVSGDIAPMGVCKLWVIEERLIGVGPTATPEEEPEEEPMEFEARAEVNLVPPAFMRASARRGLALHEEGYSGDGLKPQTVEDARKMANGEALSADKWRRIGPWIARHTVDLEAVDEEGEITPGLVAMLLWGGGSSKSSAARAQDYAERLVARMDEKRNEVASVYDSFGEVSND